MEGGVCMACRAFSSSFIVLLINGNFTSYGVCPSPAPMPNNCSPLQGPHRALDPGLFRIIETEMKTARKRQKTEPSSPACVDR